MKDKTVVIAMIGLLAVIAGCYAFKMYLLAIWYTAFLGYAFGRFKERGVL